MASAEATPRRRFAPQPVETTTRSSKRQHIEKADEPVNSAADNGTKKDAPAGDTKPRKFLPQPIEETTRSSRRKQPAPEESAATADSSRSEGSSGQPAQSAETASNGDQTLKSKRTPRKFAPEPIESTSRTSRRKFAVEPVETTSRSSKGKKEEETEAIKSDRPRRRFVPEPIEETTTSRRRRKEHDDDSNESAPDSGSDTSSRMSSRQSTGSRRFSPELIETAKGSYRHRKDSDSPRSSKSSLASSASSTSISHAATETPEPCEPCESRFSAAALAKRCHKERRHSYCIPNLPDIESESSDDESCPPSLTESPSSTDNEQHKLAPVEEDKSESYTDYVLSLTRSQERRRFQDQMMAAYVNEYPREAVAHFAGDEEDDDVVVVGSLEADNGADPKTFRRSSQDEHDWEMQEMRRHHEQLERAKREFQEDTCGASRFSAAALAARHHLGQTHKQPTKTQKQKDEDAEYARMKKAASPPMLGGDIVFPFTVSPKMTRCDVDQAPRPRRADSDEDAMSVDGAPVQLWNGDSSTPGTPVAGLWMGSCQKSPGAGGLWMGSCTKRPDASRPPTPTRSGLQTPAHELGNPFEAQTPGAGTRTPSRRSAQPYYGLHLNPLTPPRSAGNSGDEFTSSIDKKLQLEKQIEEEFTPRVITQIYNYLSLGFPSLARDFDEELSKISRISVKELRKDDHTPVGSIRGYVGAPEAHQTWEEDEDGTVKGCKRWEALRIYVREWAKQSPNFTANQSLPVVQDPNLIHVKFRKADAWGATVRKGSWAH